MSKNFSTKRRHPMSRSRFTGKSGNGILLAEDDWRAIQETLYLLAVPGMRESIRKGLRTPVHKCAKTLKW
jgi:PHD/YefM family antitoxin component YafN of YafNO toxin-antitoxin module